MGLQAAYLLAELFPAADGSQGGHGDGDPEKKTESERQHQTTCEDDGQRMTDELTTPTGRTRCLLMCMTPRMHACSTRH
jgi:hypothetical protein